MFIGDEREIVHITVGDGWVIVLSVYLWIWISLTVTVLCVREQFRRKRWERPDIYHPGAGEEDYERYELFREEE